MLSIVTTAHVTAASFMPSGSSSAQTAQSRSAAAGAYGTAYMAAVDARDSAVRTARKNFSNGSLSVQQFEDAVRQAMDAFTSVVGAAAQVRDAAVASSTKAAQAALKAYGMAVRSATERRNAALRKISRSASQEQVKNAVQSAFDVYTKSLETAGNIRDKSIGLTQ